MPERSSAPLRPKFKTWLITAWPGGFTEVYGMTEGGVGCFLNAHERPDKVHTVGYAREGFTWAQDGATNPVDLAFLTSPAAQQKLKIDLALLPFVSQ